MRVTWVICLLFAWSTAYSQLVGKVVAVSDGDTFTLLTADNKQIKVRLYGIDCPEKKQAFGQQAKQFTSEMVFSKKVLITSKGTDRYGRQLGIVHVLGQCLNEELLKTGLAWHYTQYDKYNIAWKSLETQAKHDKQDFGVKRITWFFGTKQSCSIHLEKKAAYAS